MEPLLFEDDRLLYDPGAYRSRAPDEGELVVLVDPEAPDRRLVKMVGPPVEGEGPPGSIRVLSTRSTGTRDSRRFGPVARELVLGRVWFRYAPSSRRGPIGRSRLDPVAEAQDL